MEKTLTYKKPNVYNRSHKGLTIYIGYQGYGNYENESNTSISYWKGSLFTS